MKREWKRADHIWRNIQVLSRMNVKTLRDTYYNHTIMNHSQKLSFESSKKIIIKMKKFKKGNKLSKLVHKSSPKIISGILSRNLIRRAFKIKYSKCLKYKNYQPWILHLVKLSFNKGEINTFPDEKSQQLSHH